MKKYKQKLSLLALCMSLPVLNACDSGPSDAGSDITLTGRGLNVKELTSKPTEEAPFPSSLAAGETLVLNFTTNGGTGSESVSNFTVNSAGQVIINRFNYLFSRGSSKRGETTTKLDLAKLKLSESHSFDTEKIEGQFAKLVKSGVGVSGSLAEALIVDAPAEGGFATFSDSDVKTILNAARSLGYEAQLNPDTSRFEIRVNQVYAFDSSGNNQNLIDNKKITGTFDETIEWRGLVFDAPADDSGNEIIGGRYEIEVENGILRTSRRAGEFTLTLKSLTDL